MQEVLCFGEDIADVTSLKSVVVNITRSGLACEAIILSLRLSYESSGVDSPCKLSHAIIISFNLSMTV